jgi:hypothetical protein
VQGGKDKERLIYNGKEAGGITEIIPFKSE